jgi:hypothetical protein
MDRLSSVFGFVLQFFFDRFSFLSFSLLSPIDRDRGIVVVALYQKAIRSRRLSAP